MCILLQFLSSSPPQSLLLALHIICINYFYSVSILMLRNALFLLNVVIVNAKRYHGITAFTVLAVLSWNFPHPAVYIPPRGIYRGHRGITAFPVTVSSSGLCTYRASVLAAFARSKRLDVLPLHFPRVDQKLTFKLLFPDQHQFLTTDVNHTETVHRPETGCSGSKTFVSNCFYSQLNDTREVHALS